jgi:hypothetical protein
VPRREFGLRFQSERETANTVCFQEVRETDTPYPLERPIVGRLYISKKALAEMGEPRTLIVSIAAADAPEPADGAAREQS